MHLRLNNLFSRLKNSAFIKNIFIVMSGTAVAQVIGFALSPIISRLFSPSDFGIFGSFNSVSAIITEGVTLQYVQAIVLPKEQKDAINLFFISFICTFAISFLCLIFLLLAPTVLQHLMGTSINWILPLLISAIFVNGLHQVCQAWCVRVKAFKHTSSSEIIRVVASNGMQIGLGCLRGGGVALIFASIFARIMASLNLIWRMLSDFKDFHCYVNWAWMKKMAKEYRDFPMYATPQSIVSALSVGLPVLLLNHFFGIAIAGAYAFGVRLLQIPMSFVLGPLRQVFLQKASETANHGGPLMPLYIKTTLGLFCLALLPALIFFIWAPVIFTWIFGSQWLLAGEFARYLVLWLSMSFCNLPSVTFVRIIRLQRMLFLWDLVTLSARALTLIIGGKYLSDLHTVILFSVVGAIMQIVLIVMVGRSLMRREEEASCKFNYSF